VSRDPVGEPPVDDADVAGWVAALGVPGIVDLHTHFMPTRLMDRVWQYFDHASTHYGVGWPVHYRLPEEERLAVLRALGVTLFAPLLYAHKPGMAPALTEWGMEFGRRTQGAVPTASLYPEESDAYLRAALDGGARCVKAHVQVGDFDPRDPLLDRSWGMLADAGVPVVVHCGHGPLRGTHTGLDVFGEVLRRHPTLTAVLAHAGMPEFDAALRLVGTYPRVHLDTTMVGVPFTEAFSPVPADWPARLADHADRVVLGTDFPNIPYPYATQLAAVCRWAAANDGLGVAFLRDVVHHSPRRLLGPSAT
jgi:uncharacterized protein